MRFDRADILRTAHAAARKRMAPHHSQRYGDTWCDERRAWMPKFRYRAALAERARLMRADAWFEPITTAGNARMREIYAEADAIEEAARISAMAAREGNHVAF